jgi:two-component system NarL family sensor kinase
MWTAFPSPWSREAVSNAERHAGADRVIIRLFEDRAVLCLQIEDNGTGAGEATTVGGGMGLRVMRHRARVIGGKLTIDSSGHNGARPIEGNHV